MKNGQCSKLMSRVSGARCGYLEAISKTPSPHIEVGSSRKGRSRLQPGVQANSLHPFARREHIILNIKTNTAERSRASLLCSRLPRLTPALGDIRPSLCSTAGPDEILLLIGPLRLTHPTGGVFEITSSFKRTCFWFMVSSFPE